MHDTYAATRLRVSIFALSLAGFLGCKRSNSEATQPPAIEAQADESPANIEPRYEPNAREGAATADDQADTPVVHKEIAEIMENRSHEPPSPGKDLLQTQAARTGKPATARLAFCVTPTGAVTNVSVVEPVPNDPAATDILVRWIKEFRFRPFLQNGKAVSVCTEYRFIVRLAP